MKRLCSTVLIFEAIVIGLSIPVAVHIDHLTPHAAGLTGGIAAAAAVVLATLARRLLRVTLVGGSLLQVFVIASGAVVPAMFFLGGIFAALWAVGIWLGYRVEHAASQ
jgi:4-diphosphocytidyl-2C-methyl-D-erythritol kinase